MFDFDSTPLSARVLGTALLISGLRVTDVATGTARTIVILRDIVAILRPQWRTVTAGEAMVPLSAWPGLQPTPSCRRLCGGWTTPT
jgi:hypothetical protein